MSVPDCHYCSISCHHHRTSYRQHLTRLLIRIGRLRHDLTPTMENAVCMRTTVCSNVMKGSEITDDHIISYYFRSSCPDFSNSIISPCDHCAKPCTKVTSIDDSIIYDHSMLHVNRPDLLPLTSYLDKLDLLIRRILWWNPAPGIWSSTILSILDLLQLLIDQCNTNKPDDLNSNPMNLSEMSALLSDALVHTITGLKVLFYHDRLVRPISHRLSYTFRSLLCSHTSTHWLVPVMFQLFHSTLHLGDARTIYTDWCADWPILSQMCRHRPYLDSVYHSCLKLLVVNLSMTRSTPCVISEHTHINHVTLLLTCFQKSHHSQCAECFSIFMQGLLKSNDHAHSLCQTVSDQEVSVMFSFLTSLFTGSGDLENNLNVQLSQLSDLVALNHLFAFFSLLIDLISLHLKSEGTLLLQTVFKCLSSFCTIKMRGIDFTDFSVWDIFLDFWCSLLFGCLICTNLELFHTCLDSLAQYERYELARRIHISNELRMAVIKHLIQLLVKCIRREEHRSVPFLHRTCLCLFRLLNCSLLQGESEDAQNELFRFSIEQLLANAGEHIPDALLANQFLDLIRACISNPFLEDEFGNSIRLLTFLLRFVLILPIDKQNDQSTHLRYYNLWSECIQCLSVRLIHNLASKQQSVFELSCLISLKTDVLAALFDKPYCHMQRLILINILRGVLVDCVNLDNLGYFITPDLSSHHLGSIIKVIVAECGPTDNHFKCRISHERSAESRSVASLLIRLLVDWVQFSHPTVPFHFIPWPQHRDSLSVSKWMGLQSAALVPTHSSGDDPFLTSPNNPASSGGGIENGCHGSVLQEWCCVSTWLGSAPIDSNSITDRIHLISFQTIVLMDSIPSHQIPVQSSVTIYFAPEEKAFFVQIRRQIHMDNSNMDVLSGECTIPIPCLHTDSAQIHRWHHIFLTLNLDHVNYVWVNLTTCGWVHEQICVQLNEDSPDMSHSDTFGESADTVTLVTFGQLAKSTSKGHGNLFAVGNIFVFKGESESPDPKLFGLYLFLLGPDWPGYFDSIECSSGYANAARCLVNSLARDLVHSNVTTGVRFLEECRNLLTQSDWLQSVKLLVWKSLYAVIYAHRPDGVYVRPLVPREDSNGPSSIANTSWLHSNRFYHGWQLLDSNSGQLMAGNSELDFSNPVLIETYWHPNADEAFEPHGGIDVAIYLLGHIVCHTANSHKASASRLQADCLQLVFALTTCSLSMFRRFSSPALSNPGIEVVNRQAGQKYPLSLGDFLLARLFKHPGFVANADVIEVFPNQLFMRLDNSASVFLLFNPSLLRCLCLFGPPKFWVSSIDSYPACSDFVRNGLLPQSFALLKSGLNSNLLSPLISAYLDTWQILTVALTSARECCLMEASASHSSSLMGLLVDRILLYHSTDQMAVQQSLVIHLTQLVISLDANLYLAATEYLFGTKQEEEFHFPPSSTMSDRVEPMSTVWWLRSHSLVSKLLYSDRWLVWQNPAKDIQTTEQPNDCCPESTIRQDLGPINPPQTVLPHRDNRPGKFVSNHYVTNPVQDVSVTAESESITNHTTSEVTLIPLVELTTNNSDSDDSDKLESLMLPNGDYPATPTPSVKHVDRENTSLVSSEDGKVGKGSPTEHSSNPLVPRNSESAQTFSAILIATLDTTWRSILNEVKLNEDCSLQNPHVLSKLVVVKPKLWFIHSLFGHPNIGVRAAALSGYRIWLIHRLFAQNTENTTLVDSADYLNEVIIRQILTPCLPLHVSDANTYPPIVSEHRHMCSAALLNRALEFVFIDAFPDYVTNNGNKTLAQGLSELDHFSSIPADRHSNTHLNRNSIMWKLHSRFSLPVLFSVLMLSTVDAVMSVCYTHPTSEPTPFRATELELCSTALSAVANLIQRETSSDFLHSCVDAGLLPCLYNIAWVLEFALDKMLAVTGTTELPPLAAMDPILNVSTCMSRLVARVVCRLLDNDDNIVNGVTTSCFGHVTNLVEQLLVMSTDGLIVNPSERGVDAGPVSRCLVRRILFTSVDFLTQKMEKTVNLLQSDIVVNQNISGLVDKIKHIYEQLTWAVNQTVDVLTYSATIETKTVQIFKLVHLNQSTEFVRDPSLPHPNHRIVHPTSALTGSSFRHTTICRSPSSGQLSHEESRPIDHLLNAYQTLEQSLDRALMTLLYTTSTQIQNGLLLSLPKCSPISSSDCLTMFCKSLGRLFIGKTQVPISAVALNPEASYLLKLANEEPSTLAACLASLPRLFAIVFWANLSELNSWLSSIVASDFMISHNPTQSAMNTSTRTQARQHRFERSNSLSSLHSSLSFGRLTTVYCHLEQLFDTVQALIAVSPALIPFHLPMGNFTQLSIRQNRNLLILAQTKAQQRWSSELPVNSTNTIYSNQMNSKMAATMNQVEAGEKRSFSVQYLVAKAHQSCLVGHESWKESLAERMRIVGPLGCILWNRAFETLSHEGTIFHEPEAAPLFRCVDTVEGPMRQRRRMFFTHLPLSERLVYEDKKHLLAHYRKPHPLASMIGLPIKHFPPPGRVACNWSDLAFCLPLPAAPLVQLANATRHSAIGVWACRLVSLFLTAPVEGDLVLGPTWLRFQPDLTATAGTTQQSDLKSKYDAFFQSNPLDRLWLIWSLTSINRIEPRRYALRNLAFEIFSSQNAPTLLTMRSGKERSQFISALNKQLFQIHNAMNNSVQFLSPSKNVHRRLCRLRSDWLHGHLSNFTYLMELNSSAGRTYSDLMQYPIFPWVLQDYHSTVLDLGHPNSYRRLDRPIAVQRDDRAREVEHRYDAAASLSVDDGSGPGIPPYHYPSHCSNEAIVLHFLLRLLPYTFRHLRFQDNNYDVPDRSFHSISTSWQLATTSVACVKELIPEFYSAPELFGNPNGLSLGRRQSGHSIDKVELPPWSKNNPRLFAMICRAALESDYTTSALSHWIDLIFGYKQTGPHAKEALNLYHPYTYFGAVDVDKIPDPVHAQAVSGMIGNYGQTPKQLFKQKPHPCRYSIVANKMQPQMLPLEIGEWSGLNKPSDDAVRGCDEESLTSPNDPTPDLTTLSDSNRSELTPLETVVGLRWGTWAGSPHAPILRLRWKVHLSDLDPHWSCKKSGVVYLCGALWDEDCGGGSGGSSCTTCVLDVNNSSTYRTSKVIDTLRYAWNGWTVVTQDQTDRPKHWRLSILGCHNLACSMLVAQSNNPVIVRVSSSTVIPCVLEFESRNLSSSAVPKGQMMLLKLPTAKVNCTITALSLCTLSPSYIRLFVGMSNGSIYVRCLPKNLEEVSVKGWFPQDFVSMYQGAGLLSMANHHSATTQSNSSRKNGPLQTSHNGMEELNRWFNDEVGLWELTGWHQLIGPNHPISALSTCSQFELCSSGDESGHVCVWDSNRLNLIYHVDTRRWFQNLHSEISYHSVADDPFESPTKSGCFVNPQSYQRVDSMCFSPVSGELAFAGWVDRWHQTCWIGVLSPSGSPVASRKLNFMAEITDGLSENGSSSETSTPANDAFQPQPIPMAYSTVPEGFGVNCLLLGGPAGRLIWLNAWTLDTVHTMLLPQPSPSPVSSLCFTPAEDPLHPGRGNVLGESLCQALCVADQAGWVYQLAPDQLLDHRQQRPHRPNRRPPSHLIGEQNTPSYLVSTIWIG